jgi:hypothetical protein
MNKVHKRSIGICRDWKRFYGFLLEIESEPHLKEICSLGGRKMSHRAGTVDVPTLIFGFWPKNVVRGSQIHLYDSSF